MFIESVIDWFGFLSVLTRGRRLKFILRFPPISNGGAIVKSVREKLPIYEVTFSHKKVVNYIKNQKQA